MVENPGSRDKALEALDFIFNVLKTHEQVLDKSIHDLAMVTEQISDTDLINGKVAKVEEKISHLQKQVTNLIDYFSNAKENPQSLKNDQEPLTQALHPKSTVIHNGSSVLLHCKQWGDFQAFALHAHTFSYDFKEDEKVFQARALKGNQIITYSGTFPEYSIVLRAWLSRQLETTEKISWKAAWSS